MIRRPPRSTLFPTRRSSDLLHRGRNVDEQEVADRSDHLAGGPARLRVGRDRRADRKSTRLNSSHDQISYAVFCLKKKNQPERTSHSHLTHSSACKTHRTHVS